MTNLALRIKLPPVAIPESDWPKLKSEAAGVKYAIEQTHRQDKSIALDADIDTATLSRAKAGQARLSEKDLDAFMDATASEAPLYAWLLKRGYDPRSLRKLETETERALRIKTEELDAERIKVRVLTEALTGRAP